MRVLAVWAALTGCTAHAADDVATFLFELDGAPAGVVELRLDRGMYRYTSTQVFLRGDELSSKVRLESHEVTADGRDQKTGLAYESLWLWRSAQKPGCVRAREELGPREGEVCVTSVKGAQVSGTSFGEPWTATVGKDGRLRELAVGPARFVLAKAGVKVSPLDLFGHGWPVKGASGTLTVRGAGAVKVPDGMRAVASVEDARALSRQVHERTAGKFCGEVARALVQEANAHGSDAVIVHGLYAKAGADRALPHAWVRLVDARGAVIDVDPALDVEVTPATHAPLALAKDDGTAGLAWLHLLSGEWTVARLP